MASRFLALALIGTLSVFTSWTANCSVRIPSGFGAAGLAFNGSGNPVITYMVWGKDDLKCSQWGDSAWLRKTVDTRGLCWHPSLAVDSLGNPAVSYGDQRLGFARWNGTKWIRETVEDGPVCGFSSLAFDYSGNAAIAYRNRNRELTLARHNGANWVWETVDVVEYCGHTSLAFDSQGNPAIGYCGFADSDLRVARWDATNWVLDTVERGSLQAPSLAFDGSGKPSIAYVDSQDHALKFAHWDGTNWVLQTLVGGDVGDCTSLAFDPLGNPAITCTVGGTLELARWNGTKWVRSPVGMGQVCSEDSLAFDISGNPAITYCSGLDLRLARWDGVKWDQQTVVEGRTRHFYSWGLFPIAILVPVLLLLLVGSGFYSAHSRLILAVGVLTILTGLGSGIAFVLYANEIPTQDYASGVTVGFAVLGSLAVSVLCVCAGILVLVRVWRVRGREATGDSP